jgi:GTP cyclohydrolase I
MSSDKAFLQDVGMTDLPFPMRVSSREDPDGQMTVANISVKARIMAEFDASWIDRFIQVLHGHRDLIGTASLKSNIVDYVERLEASSVQIRFDYPFFIEKTTPVSKEKCLVEYKCAYTASMGASGSSVGFRIRIPVVTTYPGTELDAPGGLFGQLSIVTVETTSREDIYPEDLVEIVDGHALTPMYSFLTREDREAVIRRIHKEKRTSDALIESVEASLARRPELEKVAVTCANFGMLHPYSTLIGTEKSRWIPNSTFEEEEI